MTTSLQARLLLTFGLVIAALAGVAFLIYSHARAATDTYQRSLSDLLQVVELTRAVDQGAQALGRLATDPTPERAAAQFEPLRQQVLALRRQLPAVTRGVSSPRVVQDLDNMTDTFLIEATAATYAFSAGDLPYYYRHDQEAAAIAGYVRDAADQLLASELDTDRIIYPAMIERDRMLQRVNLAVLADVTLVTLLFAWSFARGVTDPVRTLVQAARRIASGNLEGPPVPGQGGRELAVLGDTFNRMQDNLRQHVADLRLNAELQQRLQAEALENLKVHSLLREAELRALQSQANPHFLFNTLNMVARTALIEGAEHTRGLLETVAALMRYSLRDLQQPVTVAEEVAQVKRYMTIQGERFRDRFHFALEVDPAALTALIPCLSLQPLVENAIIHGIGTREQGGSVAMQVQREAGGIIVRVRDDGVGMSPERLLAVVAGTGERATQGGHTTGFGLYSVRRRLELLYGDSVRFAINSQPGHGTTVELAVPSVGEGVQVDANPGGGRRAHRARGTAGAGAATSAGDGGGRRGGQRPAGGGDGGGAAT